MKKKKLSKTEREVKNMLFLGSIGILYLFSFLGKLNNQLKQSDVIPLILGVIFLFMAVFCNGANNE